MNAHPEVSDELDLLAARVAALEQRVAALESPPQTIAEPMEKLPRPADPAEAAPLAAPDSGISTHFTGAFSLLGAALLGIAGAYLLRAVSGAGLLPRGVVAGLAAAYAAAWLVAAARATSRRLAESLFAVTSILILAPMLWEMSIRFQAMTAIGAAGLLAAYVAIAAVIGLQPARSIAFTIAFCGSSLTAVALSIGTHQIAPFAAMLLAMHAVCEFTPLCNRARGVQVFVALCADFSAWSLIYVYPLPAGEQNVYPPLGSAAILSAVSLLFAIQVVSLVLQTLQRAQPMGVLRLLQVMISFALLVCGLAWFIPTIAAGVIGLLCLVLAVAAFAAAYGRFLRAAQMRNFYVFLVWGCSLLIAAVFLLTPPTAASAILGLIALAAIPLARRMRFQSVAVQGVVFLSIAAFASGLLSYAFRALAGTMPGDPSWPVLLVSACALLAYAAGDDPRREQPFGQLLHLIPALLATCGVAAFLARGFVALASLALTPDVFHVAVLRTLALCVTALALARLGARLGRVQMIRVAYAALAFVTAKLLFEDLRHGHMEFIAVSIILVALTFILVPRLARMASRL